MLGGPHVPPRPHGKPAVLLALVVLPPLPSSPLPCRPASKGWTPWPSRPSKPSSPSSRETPSASPRRTTSSSPRTASPSETSTWPWTSVPCTWPWSWTAAAAWRRSSPRSRRRPSTSCGASCPKPSCASPPSPTSSIPTEASPASARAFRHEILDVRPLRRHGPPRRHLGGTPRPLRLRRLGTPRRSRLHGRTGPERRRLLPPVEPWGQGRGPLRAGTIDSPLLHRAGHRREPPPSHEDGPPHGWRGPLHRGGGEARQALPGHGEDARTQRPSRLDLPTSRQGRNPPPHPRPQPPLRSRGPGARRLPRPGRPGTGRCRSGCDGRRPPDGRHHRPLPEGRDPPPSPPGHARRSRRSGPLRRERQVRMERMGLPGQRGPASGRRHEAAGGPARRRRASLPMVLDEPPRRPESRNGALPLGRTLGLVRGRTGRHRPLRRARIDGRPGSRRFPRARPALPRPPASSTPAPI